jgi:hypothetical protein
MGVVVSGVWWLVVVAGGYVAYGCEQHRDTSFPAPA